MFTASSAQSPRRLASNHHQRGKPYGNKVKPGSGMVRSGSILGTIKNIVAAPLSWFSGGEKFEDLGKRRRGQERDATSDDEDGFGQKTKRIRMSSPVNAQAIEPTEGYLDPPASSLPPISMTSSYRTSNVLRKSAFEDAYNRSSSVFGGQSLTRTMSIDPPAQYATYNSDPSMVPLPMDSPMESRLSMSAGPRDLSMRPSASPLRLRTSLTPQPSPAKPIRREASAPPPLSSLMSKPVFVRPPPMGNSGRELKEQKTILLGSLAEYNRFTRSPSRDRMLTSLSSISSVPSSLSNSTSFNARFQSPAEKTFHELEMYKTPIIPSRYKDSKAIPEFLKPKKVHVPIPMSRKEREAKPSLGMASKGKSKGKEKAESKPYAGESGISKLLAKRQAEVEQRSRKYNAMEDRDDDEAEEAGGKREKRDVGVYAKLTSESEGESTRKHKQADAPIGTVEDPFDKQVETTQGGRRQPYGRVGRARRENAVRVVNDARSVKSNRYSATFDDEDEDTNMDNDGTAENVSKEPTKKPVFEAPAGFTFANATTTLQLDHTGAKEPPISSLPFSLTKLTESTKPTIGPSSTEAAVKVNGEMKTKTAPSFFRTPEPVKLVSTERSKEAPQPPKLEIVPPTPEQSTTGNESVAAPSSFFAAPPNTTTSNSSITTSAPSASNGIPNFFASSAVLANTKNKPINDLPSTARPSPASTSFSVGPELTSASSVVPITDPENPLWNGNDRQHSKDTTLTPVIGRPRSTSPKPLPFGGMNKPAQAPKPTANSTPSPFSFGAPPKQLEVFAHSSAAPSSSSTPLITGVTSASSSNTQTTPSFLSLTPQVNEQKPTSAEAENKSAASPSPSPFTFGASVTASTPPAPAGGSVDAPKPLFGFSQPSQVSTENKPKSPFIFGAPSNTPPTASAVDTIVPKPIFGSGAGVGFPFGAQPSSASASPGPEAGKSSPFAFGAAPATPPSGAERKDSFPGFGAASSPHTGFSFGAAVKPSEPAPAVTSSPFAFGASAPARPITPPNGDDHGMRMEESPTREMNVNGSEKPAGTGLSGGMTFGSGAASANPFGSGGGTAGSGMFNFGATASSSVAVNPFAAKNEPANQFAPKTDDRASSPFSFNRVASAPVISTSFSFGQKSDSNTPPATAFGTAPANPFGQPVSATGTSTPFSFGNPSNTGAVSNPFVPSSTGVMSNPFASSSQTTTSTPGSPFLQNGSSFSFGGPSTGSNGFSFGNTNSQPASPAGSVSGLPASPATNNAPFSFGGTNSSGGGGGALFNIGAPPPSAGASGRPLKKLPNRRGGPVKR